MPGKVILRHEFVEIIPDLLRDGVVYVSVLYATAVHKCCCGCGGEVVTPISRTDWQLTFDGESISLHPSIGNWSFACQSHYWIRRNEVRWAPRWSQERIAAGRAAAWFKEDQERREKSGTAVGAGAASRKSVITLVKKLWQRLTGRKS